jgi:hypothetical protein
MKNQKIIDDAFAELKKGGEWYEINNLIYDISDKKERQYLFDKAEQVYDSYSSNADFIDMLRWAITNKLVVDAKVFDKLEASINRLLKEKSDLINFYSLLSLAGLYQKETYPDKTGTSTHNPEKVKKWVAESFNIAETADNYSDIIAFVSEEHSGLYLGNKNWGKELLVLVKAKVDDKSYKKIEKITAPLLA